MTATLTATGGVSYTWSNGLGNTATVSANPTTTTTYTVTVTDANGCVGTDEVQVTVDNSGSNACSPTITFYKSGLDTAQAGSTLAYTFTIINQTGVVLNNVIFTDNLNSGAVFYSNPTQVVGGLQITGTTITTSSGSLTLNNVPIGTSSFQLAISVPNNYTAGTTYCNQAQLSNLSASNSLLANTKISDNPNTTTLNDATCSVIWRPEICNNGIDDDLDGLDDCNDPDCQLSGSGY